MITFDTTNFFYGIESDIKDSRDDAPMMINEVAAEAWRGVKVASPVKEGVFRGNWRVNVNQDDNGYDIDAKDKAGSKPYPEQNVKLGDSINITNALPYAEPLDAGSSVQARSGVTTPVAKKIESKLRSIR